MSEEWTDIVINISSEDLDEVAAISQMVVPRGIYIEDYSTFEDDIKFFGPVEIIDEELLNQDRTKAKVHIYISPEENPMEASSFLTERLDSAGIHYEIDTGSVREEDWANNWKKFFKPMNIGDKIRLIPTWEAEHDKESEEGLKAVADGRKILTIDPGMAFGSGQHETTRLCLTLIEKYLKSGDSMLDVGTGSGILAIGGLLLGAKDAIGVDIDPLSVKIAAENAHLNGIGDELTLICGNLADEVKGNFELISANIVADIIMMLLPDCSKLLKKNGTFIASGIIDPRLDEVLDCMKSVGLNVIEIKKERGWNAIAAKY